MAITVPSNSDWSATGRINTTLGGKSAVSIDYALNENNYNDNVEATWFRKGWFDSHYIARKFINRTNKSQRLTKFSFQGCACHSGGKSLPDSGGNMFVAYGYPCIYTCDIFVSNPDKSKDFATADNPQTLESLDRFNCYYGPYPGNVSPPSEYGNTGFGKHFWEDASGITWMYGNTEHETQYSRDSKGHRRYRYPIEFEFSNAPLIQPDGVMYVHIRVTDWLSHPENLLCIEYNDGGFDYDFNTEPRKFLWQWVDHRYDDEPEETPDGLHWRKIIDIHKRTANGWENIGEKHYKSNQE